MTQNQLPRLDEQAAALIPLRAAGLAIDPRKMLLGGLALLSLLAGDWLLAKLPFADQSIHILLHNPDEDAVTRGLSYAGLIPRRDPGKWMSWDFAAFSLLTPLRTVIEPGRIIFEMHDSWSRTVFAWTQLLWALIVWSFFGGALCRMNALQFALRKRIGIGKALRFSRRQLLGFLLAPLLPLGAIVLLLSFNWILGWLAGLIPWVGFDLLAIGWFLVLFCGFLMAMMLVGILTGWPLMIAAISAEDSDGFDGLSRAFGYLFDRPWQAATLAVTAFPVFLLSRILVGLLIGLTVTLGMTAVEGGADGRPIEEAGLSVFRMTHQEMSPGGTIATRVENSLLRIGSFSWDGNLARRSVTFWLGIPGLLLAGFGPSFFWAAATVSYFQLRHSDDGTPLSSVADWDDNAGSPPESADEAAETASDSATPAESSTD